MGNTFVTTIKSAIHHRYTYVRMSCHLSDHLSYTPYSNTCYLNHMIIVIYVFYYNMCGSQHVIICASKMAKYSFYK